MPRRVWKKPLPCRMGVHDYQAVAPATAYFLDVQCARCGRRKVIALNGARGRGGVM